MAATDDGQTPAARPSRRSVLLGAAGVTGVALGGAWKPATAGAAQAAPDATDAPVAPAPERRSYVSGYFALKLDDVDCGMVQKFAGGDIEGEVVETEAEGAYYPKKHIGNVKYEDLSVAVGLVPAKPLQDWIDSTLDGKFARKDGSIRAADFDNKVRHVQEFQSALLTEIGFPACDAGAKDPAYLSVKFAPGTSRHKMGDGKVESKPLDTRQKAWLPANFRLKIDDVDCSRVRKVDALVIKQTYLVEVPLQESSVAADQEPGKIDFPNLRITLAQADAEAFYKWHDKVTYGGANNAEDDDGEERPGTLEFLDRDLKRSLVTLTFSNIGIFKASIDPAEANSDKARRVIFECYVEKMTAKFA